MREKVIERLISNWKDLVDTGAFTEEDLHNSLEMQVEHSGQGWDMSLEDLEADPEMAEMMGYDIDNMTDEQVDEWQEIVKEAASRYLTKTDEWPNRWWEPGAEDAPEVLPEDQWLPDGEELPFE